MEVCERPSDLQDGGVMKVSFKPIKPGKFVADAFENAFGDMMEELRDDVLADYESTTATWEHDVPFDDEADARHMKVDTADEIFGFVDRGTDPHVIRPVAADRLAFAADYTRKSQPGFIGSNPGGPSGETVFAQEVQHPGTVGTGIEQTIADKYEDELPGRAKAAMKEGSKKSGHNL